MFSLERLDGSPEIAVIRDIKKEIIKAKTLYGSRDDFFSAFLINFNAVCDFFKSSAFFQVKDSTLTAHSENLFLSPCLARKEFLKLSR